jgi:hypothetical protein
MNEDKMTPEQALGLLKQVCEVFRGTLQEHQKLQEALATINDCIVKVNSIYYPTSS